MPLKKVAITVALCAVAAFNAGATSVQQGSDGRWQQGGGGFPRASEFKSNHGYGGSYRDDRSAPRGGKHTAEAPRSEPSLQQLLDKQGGRGELNAARDALADGADALWSVLPGASSTFLFEAGAYAPYNIFGVYDSTSPGSRLPLFYGFAGPGATSTLSLQALDTGGVRFTVTANGISESALFGSSVFGFYLRTPTNVFFSNTALNVDNTDHLRAYHSALPIGDDDYAFPGGSYLLAWEDLLNGGDRDFQDLLVAVSGFSPVHASPVPLPAAALLFGSGLLGLFGLRRRPAAASAH